MMADKGEDMTPESIEAARKLYESRNPVPLGHFWITPECEYTAHDYNARWQGFLDCYQIKSVIELEELRKAVVPKEREKFDNQLDAFHTGGFNYCLHEINAAFDRQILERGTS